MGEGGQAVVEKNIIMSKFPILPPPWKLNKNFWLWWGLLKGKEKYQNINTCCSSSSNRVFQRYPTPLSTCTPTQPQLNSQFDRVRVQIGAQCLNAILFLPQLTSQLHLWFCVTFFCVIVWKSGKNSHWHAHEEGC